MSLAGRIALQAILLCAAAPCVAQDAVPTTVAPVAEPSATSAPACDCPTIPALTPVSIELLAPLGSKTSKTGDTFALRLAAPLMVGGNELLPAGTPGQGEVVHAKKSGGMGAAGELVLAARYLEVGGQRLRLRSLKLAPASQSRINTVNAINVASAASPLPIGLIGFFISGGQATVPAGTIAEAKTAEPFVLPLPAATPAEAPPPSAIQAISTEKLDAVQ